jgi:hypothetical protein
MKVCGEGQKRKPMLPSCMSELYRLRDRPLLAKLVLTSVDGRCYMVSIMDPHGCILVFPDQSSSIVLTRLSGPSSRLTTSQKM